MRLRRARRTRRKQRLRLASLAMVLAGAGLVTAAVQDLWGTGVVTARAQAEIRREIAEEGLPRRAIPGKALGFVRIPAIEVDVAFVEGVGDDALAKGPGHYPETSLPGRGGNTVIAGHRTTHGAPFWSLDRLQRGDLIEVETRRGQFVYRVEWKAVLPGNAWGVTGSTSTPSLTLTTCWPRFSSQKRLVVRAVQIRGLVPRGMAGPMSTGGVA